MSDPTPKIPPVTLRPLGAYAAQFQRVCEDTGYEPTVFIHKAIGAILEMIDAEEITVPHVVRIARAARAEMAKPVIHIVETIGEAHAFLDGQQRLRAAEDPPSKKKQVS